MPEFQADNFIFPLHLQLRW